jgi:hypothetical protein
MKRSYNKDDVEFHSEYYGRNNLPAVNVKVYHSPSIYKIIDAIPELKNMEDDELAEVLVEKAAEMSFNMECELFWNEFAQEIADNHFPEDRVKIWSQGRSNGWLVVEGLKSFDEWNAIDLRRWQGFENAIKATVNDLTSLETMVNDITANKWYLPFSSQYNFYDSDDGQIHCIAEEKIELSKQYSWIN